jgi:hypothetical protein
MSREQSHFLGLLVLLFCGSVYALALSAFIATSTVTSDQWLSIVLNLSAFFAFPVVGSLIVSQRPSNTVGWLFCAIGLGTAATSFSAGYVQHALATHGDTQLATGLIDALGNAVWITNMGLGTLLLLLFPDGKLPSRRWRPVFWLDVAAIVFTALAEAFHPGPLESQGRVVNPLGLAPASPVLETIDGLGHAIFPVLALAAIASVIVRYFHASGTQRQQIKWFAYGAASMAFIITVTVVAAPDQNSVLSTLGFALAFVLLPVGAGIGVLRYRLYDIDVLINRTLVYGSLTLLLAAVYFGSVVGLQHLAAALAGSHASDNPLTVVLSTLLIAALFTPLRRRVQRTIDRRFYRAKYDAATTLERFAASLRTQTDLSALTAHVVATVEATMQPAHASLWLRPRVQESTSRQAGIAEGGMR